MNSGKTHVDCIDEDHTTPLILAAASGHVDCVAELLDQGAEVNAKRVVRSAKFHHQKQTHLKILLPFSQTGTTALFFAAQEGNLEVARVLLGAGAAVDQGSCDGATPLFVACQAGHIVMVKELLDSGAQVNISMRDHASPLFIAAQNGHRNVCTLLINRGASVDKARADQATPLWIAAQMGHDHICKILLNQGANVDALRCDQSTPLFKASHKGHAAVVEQLLKYSPNLGLLPNGESAMHAASSFGQLSVVKQLVAAGFRNFALKNREGLTPRLISKREGYLGVYEYLTEKEREAAAKC